MKIFTKYDEIDSPVEDSELDIVRQHALELGLWSFEDKLWINKQLDGA